MKCNVVRAFIMAFVLRLCHTLCYLEKLPNNQSKPYSMCSHHAHRLSNSLPPIIYAAWRQVCCCEKLSNQTKFGYGSTFGAVRGHMTGADRFFAVHFLVSTTKIHGWRSQKRLRKKKFQNGYIINNGAQI